MVGKVGLRERKKRVPVTQPVGDRAKDLPAPPRQKVPPWSSPVPWPVGEASLGGSLWAGCFVGQKAHLSSPARVRRCLLACALGRAAQAALGTWRWQAHYQPQTRPEDALGIV